MSNKIGNNNKLILCKLGYSYTYLLTFINDYQNKTEPLDLTTMSKYLKSIYSKDGEHYTEHTANIGSELGEDVFNEILEKLGEEYELNNTDKQEKDNIKTFKVQRESKITKKDVNGKAIKNGTKYEYELDENDKPKTEIKDIEQKTFKKLLYEPITIYYKDNIIIKCAKIFGQCLSPTTFANRINDELDKHYQFKLILKLAIQ